jgi:hypothetical protein
MPGCLTRCADRDLTSMYNAWFSVRDYYGPRPGSMSAANSTALYNTDVQGYDGWVASWNAEHGAAAGGTDLSTDPNDVIEMFWKWLNWRCSVGTTEYGNLSIRIRGEHEGISCVPCPYDTRSNDVRATHMLGSVPTQVDHTSGGMGYYMEVGQEGNTWGFRCTFSGCPYEAAHGRPYFYA